MLAKLAGMHLKSARGEISINIDGNDLLSVELLGKETRIRMKSILSSIEFASHVGLSRGLRLMNSLRDLGFEVKLL
ncbi:MAG: hypothetical protein PHW96_00740 [Candidatus Nanoarchaeia archaeon]|nr:hypothetical protein [Candidatus Nanoarchaeia archaeon]